MDRRTSCYECVPKLGFCVSARAKARGSLGFGDALYAGIIALLIGAAHCAAFDRSPVPIGDQVTTPLLPAGISRMAVELEGELAYLFRDADGTNVAHVIGSFACHIGGAVGPRISSREAVVWIVDRKHEGKPYKHLDLFLWRDATVREPSGTLTTAPAIYLSIDTWGELAIHVDEFAYRPTITGQIYEQGKALRATLARMRPADPEHRTFLSIFDPTGLLSVSKEKTGPRPAVVFQTEGDVKGPLEHKDRRVVTIIGRAYLSRGVSGARDYLQIQADAAVLFLPPGAPGARGDRAGLGARTNEESAAPTEAEPGEARPPAPRVSPPAAQPLSGAAASVLGDLHIEGAYLEGDVLMTVGPTMIRASRLYYDFVEDRALILDAVARATLAERNVPLYLRAARIRQVALNHLSATDAMLTTSEMHTPHYHIGARQVELINRTPREVPDGRTAPRSGTFTIRDATLNLEGVAIAYWPFLRGTVDASETAIRGVRFGYSGDFGAELESDWHAFHVLGMEEPQGFDTTLSLDYYSDRGPAIGVEAEYERQRYYGLLRSYLIHDTGTDVLGRERARRTFDDFRGRFLLRHRQFLEEDWQVTLEFSYISDRSFLEEFFESEFDNDKEQETLLQLRRQRGNRALNVLLQGHILDFVTETERLPDFAYWIIGEPLRGGFTWFSENRVGLVRRRTDDPSVLELLRGDAPLDSGSTWRVDSRQEATAPLDLGPWRIVPFAVARGSAWDDTPRDGGLGRVHGSYGLRGSTYLWRAFPDARSILLDIEGLRHTIKLDVTAWTSHANVERDQLYPFDDTVEGVHEVGGASVGVRQRLQTKRGPKDARRTVDLLTLDTELGVFHDNDGVDETNGFTSFSRPEISVARNYLNNALIWRANDQTALLSELNYDLNDGEVDVLNLALVVERPPRFHYLLGYRFIGESDSNLLGFDMSYRLTEKHTLAFRELYDLEEGRPLDLTVSLVRKLPRWFSAVSVQIDEAEDDFGVSLSIWPEGLTEMSLGSRRFTGLPDVTRLPTQ